MKNGKRRSAAEIIAFHFCSDIADIRDARYQPGVYYAPALYTLDDDYYCVPSKTQKPPKPWRWHPLAEHYGRTIYRAHMNDFIE
jgi:hypothetical protein